jgi:hypothetical protein
MGPLVDVIDNVVLDQGEQIDARRSIVSVSVVVKPHAPGVAAWIDAVVDFVLEDVVFRGGVRDV